MDTKLKKTIFISINRAIFNDSSGDIYDYNCIPFYHFLVDTLIDEIKEIPDELESDIYLCDSIIDLLCNFDTMSNNLDDWSEDSTIDFLMDYSGLSDLEFEESIAKFRKIYKFIKEDFFLGLT